MTTFNGCGVGRRPGAVGGRATRWRWGLALAAMAGASCDTGAPSAVSVEEIRGGSPPDVTLVVPEPSEGPTVNADDPSQWARDASVRLSNGCSGTLVSPRVVLTAAHCTQPSAPGGVSFSPRFDPGQVGEVLRGTPSNVDSNISYCEIHPERDGSCGDGVTDLGSGPHPAREHDLAVSCSTSASTTRTTAATAFAPRV